VETEGVGPVLGSGVEHASHGLALVVTGMNTEHRAVGKVEPGDDMDPLPNGQIPHRRLVSLVEDQPGVGPALGALFRRLRGIGEGRFDVADRVQLVAHG
jgi:hypothetical protein